MSFKSRLPNFFFFFSGKLQCKPIYHSFEAIIKEYNSVDRKAQYKAPTYLGYLGILAHD